MSPTPAEYLYLGMIRQVIDAWSTLSWLKPSYIMAEIAIESGFDPVVVNATGRQDGLMQVIPGTVAEVVAAYSLARLVQPQTDPYTSIEIGSLYFNTCARKILASRGARSLYLEEVAEAYNLGYGGFIGGKRNQRYGLKFLAAQTVWAFVDAPVAVALDAIPALEQPRTGYTRGLGATSWGNPPPQNL